MNKIILALLFLVFTSSFCDNTHSEQIKSVAVDDVQQPGMQTLGLIDGTSWHSTIDYYSTINQTINDHFGNNTNPPLIIYNLNQAEVHRFQIENKWDSIAYMLVTAGTNLNKAGASSVLFCANTPHKVYGSVQEQLNIPIIHIADATAKSFQTKGISKVCFLGTKYSMQEDFITKRIEDNGLEVLVPQQEEVINELHRIIQEELNYGKIIEQSKKYVLEVIGDLIDQGAEGVVLGCTEFPLMIFQEDLKVPMFNTTEIHFMSAVECVLNQ